MASLDGEEPILRYVDLSTTHMGSASKLALPAWARTIIPGPGGAPLLYAGELDGRKAGVLAFEPRQSDLPLQVAFPILVSNLAGELMGGSAAPTAAGAPAATGGTGAGNTTDRPPARDELWVPIVLIAIAVLLTEWIVYQRDAVTRLWRGFRGRPGGGGGA